MTDSTIGGEEVVAGRGAASGLRSLLEHHVSRADVLESCLQAWRESFPAEARRLGERNDLMTTVVIREQERPALERDLVGAYHELCDLADARAGTLKRLAGRKESHD
jgi:hypothetical protein